MSEKKHQDIPPYFGPVYYKYRAEERRRMQAAKMAPSQWRNQAGFQGIVALGFTLLGRTAAQNGWPFWLWISMSSAPEALKKSTQALSNYLSLRKQHRQYTGKI